MKGTDSDEETREAENAILTLGAALESVTDYKLPGVNVVHRAVKIRKTAPTPDDYPRRYAKIEKKPL